MLRAKMSVDPLVLIPGMMCDARLWWPFLSELSAERSLHLPAIAGAETISEMASAVLASAPEKFAMLGFSMGGIVAMDVIRRAPERVTRVMFMDTSPLAETPNQAAAREPHITRAKAGRLEYVMRDEVIPSLLRADHKRDDIAELMLDMALSLGPDVFVAQSRALQRRDDQQGTLRRIRVPCSVVCGEFDALTPPRRHEQMADLIPRANLEIIGGASHIPILERPSETLHVLRNWLEA